MTRLWILSAIVIVILLGAVYVKSNIDREDEVVDDTTEEVVAEVGNDTIEDVADCTGLSPQTRKNCLLARDGLAYEL